MERLGKARRGGEEAYRRQQAIEEADRHIRSSGVTDPEAKDAIRKEYSDRSAMASAYEAEARVLGDLHGRRERAIQDQEAINRLYKEGAIDAGQYRRLWRDAEIARLEDSQNANDGMTRGLLKYVRDAEDAASQVESLTANAFRGMEDVFVDFAKTGKLSFSKLADSIIEDITRMTAKALLLAPLAQFLASVFGTGGGAGGNVNLGSLGSMAMMGGGGGSGLNIGSFGGLAAGAAGMMGAGGGMSNLWSYLTTPDYLWSGGSPFDFFSAAPDMSGAVDLFANVPMEGAGELMDLGMMAFRNGGVFANDNVSSFAHGSVFGGRTMFSFANGGLPSLGELAEAGRSEGIIPLVRGPNGDLGVQNFGGGAGGANVQVTVEVYDQRRSGTDDIEVETFMTKLGPVVRIIAKDEADKRVGEFRNREMPALMRGDYSMSRQPVAR
ncbi:MAG: hypothetical protein HY985_17860 [Magnetospirillum sp.]|nr:hypothetical protein [Magnetospirillum sp.]